MYDSLQEAVEAAEKAGISLGELALETEAAAGLRTREQVEAGLQRALNVMRGAVERGLKGDLYSVSGLVGGDAARVARGTGPLAGTVFGDRDSRRGPRVSALACLQGPRVSAD